MMKFLKFLGRGAGAIIAGIMGFVTFSCALTTVLYFTPAIGGIGLGRRLLSILFVALLTYISFKLTKQGVKLYKVCKPDNSEKVEKPEQNINGEIAPVMDSKMQEPKTEIAAAQVSSMNGNPVHEPVERELVEKESVAKTSVAPSYKLYTMWERSIVFCDGWYLFLDGKGQCSVITHEQAREHEAGYVRYQASQDINRGGAPEEVAYASRGLKKVLDENGHFLRLDLVNGYCVDKVEGEIVKMRGTITIPERIGGHVINYVCDSAFYNCKELEKVILPNGIKRIGRQAFYGCSMLKEVVMPGSVINIGDQAFEGTRVLEDGKLERISGHMLVSVSKETKGEYSVPESVTVIAEHAFKNCTKLKKIVVHDGVTNIGLCAFSGCSALKEIVLPKSIKELGFGAFSGCSSLVNVVVPEGVQKLNHFEGCTSLEKVTIPDTVTCISESCFRKTGLMEQFHNSDAKMLEVGDWIINYNPKSSSELIIRDGIVGIADQDTMEHSYYQTSGQYKGISSIKLPDTLRYIGADAFSNTGIEEIKLPEGLMTIGMNAFRDSALKSITIPKSVKSIDKWAFMGCKALECIIFEGNTLPTWPAIVGRENGKAMRIVAKEGSPAHSYAKQYREKYNLVFEELGAPVSDGKSQTDNEPVVVEDNRITLNKDAYFAWHEKHRTPLEKCGAIALKTKTPSLLLYEGEELSHEYVLGNTKDEDYTGKYFLYSVRMSMVGNPVAPVVQIDGFVADSPDEESMGSNTGYRFEGYHPYFGGIESSRRRLVQSGADLIEKGLKYPGYITPANVRLVGICDECGKSLTFIGYNYPGMNAEPLYSDDGTSVIESYDYNMDKDNGVVEKDGRKYRYYNSFCCKYCGHPYIDYNRKREMKQYGNLGCVYVE